MFLSFINLKCGLSMMLTLFYISGDLLCLALLITVEENDIFCEEEILW